MSHRVRLLLVSVSAVVVSYIVIGGVLGKGDSTGREETYRDLGVYSEVLSRINSDYVVEPNLQKVTNGAIRGLLEALDPYSTYFTPKEFAEYQQHPNPGPANVGLFISKRFGYTPVVSVLPGSPAEKAGIKAGDLVDRLGTTPLRELSVVQINRLLAGDPGTQVTLWVVREARGEPQKIVLNREVIAPPPVIATMADSNTAYLRVSTFAKGTAADLRSKLQELVSQGADKVVLDLRDCAGGEVDEAVQTTSLFLNTGLVGYAEGQRYPRENLMVKPWGPVFKQPLAVLIDRSTAGPAELVAAAVLDDKAGEVVGSPSYGVGVVTKMIPVGDGSALLLAVAKYYGPDGKAIQDNGVIPSITLSTRDENSEETLGPDQYGSKDDPTLRKAIEVLKQKDPMAKAA